MDKENKGYLTVVIFLLAMLILVAFSIGVYEGIAMLILFVAVAIIWLLSAVGVTVIEDFFKRLFRH